MRKIILLSVILLVFLSSCTNSPQSSLPQNGTQVTPQEITEAEPVRLRIAQQFGLGYAAMTIADELGFFEKYSPDLKVTWIQMSSDEAIFEAFNNGQIDAAVITIPAFLIGWDQGIVWKVASGICVMPITMQTLDGGIETLADFTQEDRIAVSALGSIEHVLLLMSLEKEFGDAAALNDNILTMSHQEALTAMAQQRDITAHFSPPPYNLEESKLPGVKSVVDGLSAFGADFSFLVAAASNDLYENNPSAYAAFVMAIAEATEFIHENPEEAATILAPSLGLDEATVLEYLTWPGMNYMTTPVGLMGFSDFMLKAGFITNSPDNLRDIAFSNVLSAIGENQGGAGVLERLQFRLD
ncbi:MAG: ABC transporter substrate-binding protein [Chloroflexi bacterium]|nr:ABC transporter substrate-binding protein [Chloroflexota bacterium]